ncbi:hypothetical protein QBC47DRAFT_387065 [Echria macrotheca]|uniref:Uncharacterized protein n=1 Tax=Echria macrotheca TaxID=438768 RepID=A0AAJ0B8P9_9PEZI|nr:hypothetical protein QBC47DRAFT_387065 [Echria macrotheca]
MHTLSFAVLALATAHQALSTPLTLIPPRSASQVSTSKAYRLIVNVTRPALDFTPPSHGLEIGRLRDDPSSPTSFRAVSLPAGSGTVFFQTPNPEFPPGTTNAEYFMYTQAVSDDRKHLQPLQLWDSVGNTGPFETQVRMDLGQNATEGMVIIPEEEGQSVPRAWPTTQGLFVDYILCNTTTVEGKLTLDVLAWTSWGPDYSLHVPAGCLHVELIPQCVSDEEAVGDGEALGDEVKAAWAEAQTIRCYEDVRGIDWRDVKWP